MCLGPVPGGLDTETNYKKNMKQPTASGGKIMQTSSVPIDNYGTWSLDIVTNSMIWTEEVYLIFGLDARATSPMLSDYMAVIHGDDRENVEAFFQEVTKTGVRQVVEYRILTKHGQVKHLSVAAQIRHDEATGSIVLHGTVLDITDRQALKKPQPPAPPKTSAQQEVLSNVGFKIRTPLSSIIGLLHLLEKTPCTSQQLGYLEGLKTSVDLLSLILQNLFNYSLLLSDDVIVKEEEVRLDELFGSIEKIFQLKAGKTGFRLAINVSEHLPPSVRCDADKYAVAVHNLLDLALLLSAPSKSLEVRANKTLHGRGRIHLLLSILYKGQPLPELRIPATVALEEMLDDLSTIERASTLGLANAHKIAELLGGTLRLSSPSKQKHLIELEIPVQPVLNKVSLSGQISSPLNILLMEDNFLNQLATQQMLMAWSKLVHVDVARNGREGLSIFSSKAYDLVLMDIQMPEMDGVSACRIIRAKSQVPIIALSANTSKQEEERCQEAGINAYLAKPIRPEDLKKAILAQISQDRSAAR